jgi:hypothetical protein
MKALRLWNIIASQRQRALDGSPFSLLGRSIKRRDGAMFRQQPYRKKKGRK